MRCHQLVEPGPQRLGDAVDRVVAHAVVGHQVVLHGRRGHVGGLAAIGIGGDGRDQVGGVVGLLDDVGGNRDHGDVDGRREIAQRGYAQARRLQRDVELAVLHELDALPERQVLDLGKVFVRQPGGGEDRPCVELGARLRCADRDLLALQVGQCLDAGIGTRDDLDVVGIDGRDAAQFLERRLEAGVLAPFPGVGQRVTQRERDFAAARLQQVKVFHRRLGRLDGRLDAGQRLADVVGQRHAERVIDAAGAAGEHVDELVGGDRRCGKQEPDGER